MRTHTRQAIFARLRAFTLALLLATLLGLASVRAALAASRTLVVWGQTSVPAGLTSVTAIAAGELHTVALGSPDTSAPAASSAGTQATISLAAADALSGVASATYSVDGGPIVLDGAGAHTISLFSADVV